MTDDTATGTVPQRYPRMLRHLQRLWQPPKGRAGLTQAGIADMLGISQGYASRILNGREPLLCDHCVELLAAFPDHRRLWRDWRADVLREPLP